MAAQIISFPRKNKVQQSNGYDNLARLIAIADTTETLNFYMECIDQLESKGNLLCGEAKKLVEQGREKRINFRHRKSRNRRK